MWSYFVEVVTTVLILAALVIACAALSPGPASSHTPGASHRGRIARKAAWHIHHLRWWRHDR